MEVADPTTTRRSLGSIDAGCVVIGAIIGVGIFFTPSSVVATTGTGAAAMIAWAIGGLIALLGAWTFAQLGRRYPQTGGQYAVLRDAYGPLVGFVYVVCNATAVQAGAIAIIAVVCTDHIATAVGVDIGNGWPTAIVATILIVGLTSANCLGVRWGATIQNLTVLSKLLTLLTVIIAATVAGDAAIGGPVVAPESPVSDGGMLWSRVMAALVPAFFAFGGWQTALWIAGEIKSPRRTLPLAIVGGVVVVVIAYLAVNWAYLHLLGPTGVAQSKTVAADALGAVGPDASARIIAGAIAISAFGVLNVQLLSGPRLIERIAADGDFIGRFATVSPRWGTPVAAICLLGSIALGLLWAAGAVIDMLLTGVVFIDGVFFALTGIAWVVLSRRRRGPFESERSAVTTFVAIGFVMGECAILLGAAMNREGRNAAFISSLWLAAAVVVYLAAFRPGRR